MQVLRKGLIAQLKQLRTVTYDGDLISKDDRTELVGKKLATEVVCKGI